MADYPSWLPSRPPPPQPQSEIDDDADGSPLHGRRPAPRSVRIVNLSGPPPKAWSRPTVPAPDPVPRPSAALPLPQPRFNAKNLHIEHLRSPSARMKAYFYLWPVLVVYHVPLQSFFDFNAVCILLQVAHSRPWALATTAYIACWLVWVLVVLLTYELIYSFARRWRLRRPLILPIYLSSPAFNLAALSSFSTFSFLQHIRFSTNSPKQFLAESAYFYSQNLPTVGLLLPRAALSLALLLSFSTPSGFSKRDSTFFDKQDGTLTNYAKGILLANAAWTAWRTLVLLLSWLALWLFSSNRLAGLCGPRHIWEEESQEKSRSVYSSAASEHGARNSWLYADEGGYAGDELPWEWRENTRLRVQDAFEFCLVHRKRSDGLVWGSQKNKDESDAKRGFEGVEKVLAAIGFGATPSSPSRGPLTRDLFDTPEPEEENQVPLLINTPKMAKRNSKDKDFLNAPPLEVVLPPAPQSTAPGAPLLSLPYPFVQNGVGRVSSRDGGLVPFPASVGERRPSESSSSSSGTTGSSSTTTSSSTGDDDDEEEDDVDGSEDPSSNRGSESMSSLGQPISPSRGYPFVSGATAGTRTRPPGHGHARNPSGVSSAMSRAHGRRSISSGATGTGTGTGTGSFSGGGYSNRYSYSASSGGGGAVKSLEERDRLSVVSRSTGNKSTTSEEMERERSISVSGSERGGVIPMPPRHPNLQSGSQGQGQVRTRKVAISAPSSASSSSSASGRLSVPVPSVGRRASPVVFPSASRRVDGGIGSDVEERYEDQSGLGGVVFEGYEWAGEEGEDEIGEREDRLGLLGVSPRVSMVSVREGAAASASAAGNGGGGRSRTHSFHSFISSASSSSRSRTRMRTESGEGLGEGASPTVRERASSVGGSVRSLVVAASSGLGLGQRSRVNSSMARLEEEREDVGGGGIVAVGYHSRSGSESVSGSGSGGENYTFGRPVAFMKKGGRVPEEERVEEEGEGDAVAPSVRSEQSEEAAEEYVPGMLRTPTGTIISDSHMDISTAAASFITAPPSYEGGSGEGGSGSDVRSGEDSMGMGMGGNMGMGLGLGGGGLRIV